MTDDEPTGATGDPDLSVVVITKNEEDRVRQCIESVIAACRNAVDSFEVTLVDSASTDRTVERAREYPVTVLRIDPDHAISAGAGRHVGERAASGDAILHVDGDMVLTETWLPEAIGVLRANPDVAAVRGQLNDGSASGIEELDTVGGLTLFDADALLSVGGFDPYLVSNEDLDVGFRLTRAGYRILRLPTTSATHPTGEALSEPLRRWSAGYYFGPGQAMRKWVDEPRILRRLVAIHNYEFSLLGWAGVGVLCLLATPLLVGWTVLTVLGLGVVAAKLGFRGGLQFVLAKTLGTVGMLIGFVDGTRSPSAYPLEAVEVVQDAPTRLGQRRPVDR